MEATVLYLANGLTRTVKGNAADVGATLKRRTLGGEDDGFRQFVTLDGETLTVNAGAVALTEAATTKTTKQAFGFSRALEA